MTDQTKQFERERKAMRKVMTSNTPTHFCVTIHDEELIKGVKKKPGLIERVVKWWDSR